MSWLITGGAGFIGSHLAGVLLGRGEHVAILDDCSTGALDNLAHLRGDRLSVHVGDVGDADLVERLTPAGGTIVHLAAAVGVRRILDHQVAGIRTNILGTEAVLTAAERRKARVFLASTSEVYGRRRDAPFAEDDDCLIGPSSVHRWSYAASKLVDEFLALAWWRERGVPVTIARYFNVCGPRQSARYGMVLPNFCRAALDGKPLEVHGDGAQSRCFLHVDDAVRATLALIEQPRAIGQVTNIGSTEEVTIAELARRVVERAGSSSPVAMVPYSHAFPDGGFADMPRRVPDLARLRGLTGWKAQRDLAGIIDDTIAQIRGVRVSDRLAAAAGG
ncbi:MAG TPA: NAD-dependent epimerase/dehydratase family protein [Planctomycetota bacterium]|nr:NAD-dependent epimerase/dehydratase family protein [Planctomycetota bacterium]